MLVADSYTNYSQINEASARTLDFARTWAQRFHHGSRSGYFHEALPSLTEMDDVLRHSHRIFENLSHLRELVIAQQTAMSEQRARQAEEYRGLPDGYRNPALGDRGERDAKKQRRGVSPILILLGTVAKLTRSSKRLRPRVDAIAATVPKHQNGEEDLTERAPCAMHAGYITPS